MKSFAFRFAIAAILLSSAAIARAEDSRWYLGAGLGYSYANMYPADFSTGNPAIHEDHKYYDAGYKVFMGYQLDRNWALEGSYVTLGKFQYNYMTAAGDTSVDYRVTGFGFSLIPIIHLGDSFSIFGRIGVFSSQAKSTVASGSGAFTPAVGNGSDNSSEISPLLGAGFQLDFTRGFGVRLEYENYGKVGSEVDAAHANGSGRAKAQMGSLSAVFRF